MSGKMTWQKILILGALFVAPMFLAQCGPGGGENVPSAHVGPTGPTSPNGYYFELTVTPHTLYRGGWVMAVVRVWDEYGNLAPYVRVAFTTSGFNKVEIMLWEYTNMNGLVQNPIEVEADTNYIGYITAEVEGTFLTLPVSIIAGPSTG